MDVIALLHGNNVATPASDEIRITRVFDAPRALVWKAWTTPAMLVQWFGCAVFTTISAEADVRDGGNGRRPRGPMRRDA
ncbi:MAG TPA: SRPBCC domain-containing protein, partial [Flavobacteriales bacterium]|nr:SRPBCC domain-containing protein [Flavobacteriales bacterium]